MKKAFKICWWIVYSGWFPMMFATMYISRNSSDKVWFSACFAIGFILLTIGGIALVTFNTPMFNRVFNSLEELENEIAENKAKTLEALTLVEAVKRLSSEKLGFTKEAVEEKMDVLRKNKWKP